MYPSFFFGEAPRRAEQANSDEAKRKCRQGQSLWRIFAQSQELSIVVEGAKRDTASRRQPSPVHFTNIHPRPRKEGIL